MYRYSDQLATDSEYHYWDPLSSVQGQFCRSYLKRGRDRTLQREWVTGPLNIRKTEEGSHMCKRLTREDRKRLIDGTKTIGANQIRHRGEWTNKNTVIDGRDKYD